MNLRRNDPQLRHIDRAWASTVHAFQGRTVDRVIAAMEADHPHLTTQKTFYVEISRARHHAELVTDDRNALRERLEAATGGRISALEAVTPAPPDGPATGRQSQGQCGARVTGARRRACAAAETGAKRTCTRARARKDLRDRARTGVVGDRRRRRPTSFSTAGTACRRIAPRGRAPLPMIVPRYYLVAISTRVHHVAWRGGSRTRMPNVSSASLPVRRLPPDIQRRARMRLQRVVTADALSDLRAPSVSSP